jgi:hypothetical protein
MKATVLVLGIVLAASSAQAYEEIPLAPPKPVDMSGVHDFDFLAGTWRVHHRRLKERLTGSHEWIDFDGTQTAQLLMDGSANMDDNVLEMPTGTYRGVTLRAYDPKTGYWQIWWLDGRNPHADLDPPMRGRFEHGVGTFYADDTLRGMPIKERFIWQNLSPTKSHWEQAFSADGGKTWETNWTSDFERIK